ncbi:unnamed protein product [Aspergillus oryzae]|uniref:Unnamed protein product n=1 Tax=Aspergillus oryzae TaxID=5062 RepID=A0AAN4YCE3_ASPOZ|nr:unnamed protein product [Aspergillus oryzae]
MAFSRISGALGLHRRQCQESSGLYSPKHESRDSRHCSDRMYVLVMFDSLNPALIILALIALHGFLIGNATIYNSPIGFACSFNPEVSPSFLRPVKQGPPEQKANKHNSSLSRKWHASSARRPQPLGLTT